MVWNGINDLIGNMMRTGSKVVNLLVIRSSVNVGTGGADCEKRETYDFIQHEKRQA